MHTNQQHQRETPRTALRQQQPAVRPAPRAFTLVELLVAMTILVILTTLVIVGFQPEDDDRVSASARTLQSYLEGAKSRAISQQQPVGVRLIPSQNDGRVVDSLQYVAGNSYLEGTLAISQDASNRWIIANSLTGEWPRLNAGGRNLIQPGQRIEIPAGTGNWYTLGLVEDGDQDGNLDANEDDGTSSPPFDNANGRLDVVVYEPTSMLDLMSISGHYEPSVWNTTTSSYQAQPALGVPYRLELAASTLPGSDPVQLERGIVIDLDASRVPATWRPAPGAPYIATMHIMFDARGNPSGDLVAQGLIHLYLTTVGDVELTRNLIGSHPANGGGTAPPIVPANPPNTPETEPRVVTLFTQTGQVMRSQVNFSDTSPADFQADDPYRFARRGREAQ